MDPNQPDAYNILSERARSITEEKELLLKGIKASEKQLGQAYFRENKGHFWGLIETRPYMRAKLNYAICLWETGDRHGAIQHYKELLELNPDDNQGVRYTLLSAYLETKQYDQAKVLMAQYEDEGTANFEYNRVLLEYYTSGITPRLTALIRDAKNQNPHVLDYLLRKKKIPREQPEYIGFGDPLEAIAYSIDHAELWWKEAKLMDWLRKVSQNEVTVIQ